MNHNVKSEGMLVLTALIWGSSFVAQSVGMDYIGPFTFNSLRNIMGAIVLIPLIYIVERKRNEFIQNQTTKNRMIEERKKNDGH